MVFIAHQVPWNKEIYDEFVNDAMLSPDMAYLLKTRIMEWTISQQASYFNCSESTINNRIKELKDRYDAVQVNNPKLPKRRFSAKELYMDTH